MTNETARTRRLAVTALLAALIVVMQVLSYVIPIRPFNLALVLIPIVVGACLLGPRTGALLGGVFGVVVTIASIALICLLKGVLAGLLPGLVAAAFAKGKHPAVGCWIAGLLAPIVNTGIFLGGTLLVFRDVLLSWALDSGYGSALTAFIVFGLLGVNFLIEFALNAVFAPAIVRIVQAGHTVTHRAE